MKYINIDGFNFLYFFPNICIFSSILYFFYFFKSPVPHFLKIVKGLDQDRGIHYCLRQTCGMQTIQCLAKEIIF
jgi:hypothetical protein